jgi:hypothetical protein
MGNVQNPSNSKVLSIQDSYQDRHVSKISHSSVLEVYSQTARFGVKAFEGCERFFLSPETLPT